MRELGQDGVRERERETTPMRTGWGEKETTVDASHNVDCSSDAVIKLTC